jgi:hypothetical protein
MEVEEQEVEPEETEEAQVEMVPVLEMVPEVGESGVEAEIPLRETEKA